MSYSYALNDSFTTTPVPNRPVELHKTFGNMFGMTLGVWLLTARK